MTTLYFGYDPGGGGAHGVASIDGANVSCDTLATAQDAITWFSDRSAGRADVVLGVDAFTLWSSGPSGWRPADRALRARFPEVIDSVTAPNSLRGAMPVNGAVVMRALGTRCGKLRVTETHPKVLYFALTNQVYNFGQNSVQMIEHLAAWIGAGAIAVPSEHAWDAVVSAYAARQWHTGAWPANLHGLPNQPYEELIPVQGNRAFYGWPEVVTEPPAAPVQAAAAPRNREGARERDLWLVAAERLRRAGHHDVADQIEAYRNVRGERAGWDAWLRSEFPSMWSIYEAGD